MIEMSKKAIDVALSMTDEQSNQIFTVLSEKNLDKQQEMMNAMPKESLRVLVDFLEAVLECRKEASREIQV